MKIIVSSVLNLLLAHILLSVAPLQAAAQSTMYVPLGSAGEVVMVDTTTDTAVGKIKDLPAVHGLAGTPDGRLLIAGSFDERESGAPARPSGVSEEEHAAHHALPSDGSRQKGGATSTVSVVRTADNSVVRRIDVPGAVHHVAVKPDGKVAVVTHPNGGAISAIDLSSFKVVATVATGALPNYAAFSPDGRVLYVSNGGDGTISVVDTARWILERNIVVGESPEHIVLSKDGGTLFVNDVNGGAVSVVSVQKGQLEKMIPIGELLHGIDLSDDGRTLYVSAMGDDKLAGVKIDTGVYRSVSLAPAPYHLMTVSGTGKLYVSSADEPKVWVVDQNTFEILGEIVIGGKGHQMVLVPSR